MRVYILFGPPGAGKGTQRKMLEETLEKKGESWMSVSVGDLLREFTRDNGTALKQHLVAAMKSGDLVPSVFPLSFVISTFAGRKEMPRHVIFDGTGRKLVEAELLYEFLTFLSETEEIHALLLNIPDDEVITRLRKRRQKDGREDDRDETIRSRLEYYRADTRPSVEFLRGQNVRFHNLDATGDAKEVRRRIAEAIGV